MSGKKSRTKGHSFEREIAQAFRPFFPKACRQLEYQEGLGVDLANTGRLRIQCKRYKGYAPLTKIKEAGDEGVPVLVTRADRERTLIALRLDDFFQILQDSNFIYEESHVRREERREEAGAEESDRQESGKAG